MHSTTTADFRPDTDRRKVFKGTTYHHHPKLINSFEWDDVDWFESKPKKALNYLCISSFSRNNNYQRRWSPSLSLWQCQLVHPNHKKMIIIRRSKSWSCWSWFSISNNNNNMKRCKQGSSQPTRKMWDDRNLYWPPPLPQVIPSEAI
jgi:hypothetical protein